MSVAAPYVLTLIVLITGIVIGLLLLLRSAGISSRPMRALRRRLLGSAWQPVLMEPAEITVGEARGAARKAPSAATH